MQPPWREARLAPTLLSRTPSALRLELLFTVGPVVRTTALTHLVAVLSVVPLCGGALYLGVVAVLRTKLGVLLVTMAVAPTLGALLLRLTIALRICRALRSTTLPLVFTVRLGIGGVSLTPLRAPTLRRGGRLPILSTFDARALAIGCAYLLEVRCAISHPVLPHLLGMRGLPLPALLAQLVGMTLAIAPSRLAPSLKALTLGARLLARGTLSFAIHD
ncbi:MAG: hypothetical protein CMH35_03500 [Microbacterium sp.]|nr:hypothetical protein [Microbacterium sp.]